jgi:hypothetical protein
MAATAANQREQDFPVAIFLLLQPKKAQTGTRVPDADKDSPGRACRIPFPDNLTVENALFCTPAPAMSAVKFITFNAIT